MEQPEKTQEYAPYFVSCAESFSQGLEATSGRLEMAHRFATHQMELFPQIKTISINLNLIFGGITVTFGRKDS